MVEVVKDFFRKIPRGSEEQQIQSSVTYHLKHAAEFNSKASVSSELGIPEEDKNLFESLLAASILEKETKITDRVQDPIAEMLTETIIDFNVVLDRKDPDKIALQRIKDTSGKSLDDLPENNILKRGNMSLVIGLLSSIYVDSMKNKIDFKESFDKRKEYIKRQLVE